jgi:hypothetical protein
MTCRGTAVPLLLSKKIQKLTTSNTSVMRLTGCQLSDHLLLQWSFPTVICLLCLIHSDGYGLPLITKKLLYPFPRKRFFLWGTSLDAITDCYSGVNLRPWLWMGVSYLLGKLAEKMYRRCIKRKFLSLCTGYPLPVVQFVTNLGSVMHILIRYSTTEKMLHIKQFSHSCKARLYFTLMYFNWYILQLYIYIYIYIYRERERETACFGSS